MSIKGRLGGVPDERMHLWLMLALTFATGVIDAVGYLGLDRVFTGNMTGNVVILGMAVVGADDLPVLGPVLALLGFMAGAALGGRVLRAAGGAWTRLTTAMFGLVSMSVLGLGVVLLATGDEPGLALRYVSTGLLGGAMGAQAATARFIAVKDVTTVVVTSTITGLAADSVLGSGKGGGTGRRLLAVVIIILGAAAGALVLRWTLAGGVLLAGAVVAVVTLIGWWHARAAAGRGPQSAP